MADNWKYHLVMDPWQLAACVEALDEADALTLYQLMKGVDDPTALVVGVNDYVLQVLGADRCRRILESLGAQGGLNCPDGD